MPIVICVSVCLSLLALYIVSCDITSVSYYNFLQNIIKTNQDSYTIAIGDV